MLKSFFHHQCLTVYQGTIPSSKYIIFPIFISVKLNEVCSADGHEDINQLLGKELGIMDEESFTDKGYNLG